MIASALAASSPQASTWHTWQLHEPALDQSGFDELRAELRDRSTTFARRDEILGSLIRLGATDPHALLAVVVLLLPGLRRATSRYGRFLDIDERWATILAALWDKLACYDTDRRPHHVAANLIWDATRTLLQASRREEAHVERTALLTTEFEGGHPVATATEDMETLQSAVTAGVLTPTDATLIDATRLRGVDLRSAALLLGLSYEAAKKRRRRAEVAWAHWWDTQNPKQASPPPNGSSPWSRTLIRVAA